jgi:hypothetical protein
MITKPVEIFDRDHEWSALSRLATDDHPGATLGVVSGRRRQGKTYLLQALCQATGGFYFGATEAVAAESLRRIGHELTEFLNSPVPFRPTDWHEVVDALLALGRDRPVPVVLDEFPYLARATPELPSILQSAYAPLREQRTGSRTRLLLCGSAISFMGQLLSGAAPLRGRAGLELVVRTLDHQLAADFWGIVDHRLAVQVNAVVGGTPAYRRELARDDVPESPDDFDAWVTRTVLDPQSPLFREARYLLAEEPDLHDTALYHSVLAAVAEGNPTRGGIANYLGRKASDLTHPLHVLEDAGLLVREADAFRDNRSSYRIAEPLITFYHAIMRPVWDQLERAGNAGRVWHAAQRRFSSKVLGPRFEQICRDWALFHSDEATLGGMPARVGHGTIADPASRSSHEVDVVVIGTPERGKPPLLAIGEAKWGDEIGPGQLARLRRVRSLLADQGRYDTTRTRLCCFGANGFATELRAAAAQGEVTLIGLEQLYAGPG